MITRTLLLTAALLCAATAFAQDPAKTPPTAALAPVALPSLNCTAQKAPADITAACTKADTSEAALHAVYLEVFKALASDPVEQEDFSAYYLGFLESREGFCKAEAGDPFNERAFPESASDYTCITDKNNAQPKTLRLWTPGPAPASLAGDYIDGWNGSLTVVGVSGNKAQFKMEVVRGITFHMGEIEGEFIIAPDGKTAKAEIPSEDGSTCILDLDLAPRRIRVRETDCNFFHGARAYFDGTYRLTSP